MQPEPPRPTGVTLLAVLAILCGLAGAGFGALESTVHLFGFILLIISLYDFTVGIGFLGGKGWSRTMGMIVAPFAMIQVTLLSAILDIGRFAFSGLGTVVVTWIAGTIWIMILFYLTRPRVKAFFTKERRW